MRPGRCVSVIGKCRSVRCCGISFLCLKLVGKSYMIEDAAGVSYCRMMCQEVVHGFWMAGQKGRWEELPYVCDCRTWKSRQGV